MSQFVINEWLWADLSGSNGRTQQKQTVEFLYLFAKSPHQLVIIQDTAFDRKAWALCSASQDPIAKLIGSIFVAEIRQNFDRCLLLHPNSVAPLPDALATSAKPDDHYLLSAQLSAPGSILVSTDRPLCEIVQQHGLACMSREEFLESFGLRTS